MEGPVVVRDRDDMLVHCEFVAQLHSKQVSVVFVPNLPNSSPDDKTKCSFTLPLVLRGKD